MSFIIHIIIPARASNVVYYNCKQYIYNILCIAWARIETRTSLLLSKTHRSGRDIMLL